MNDPTGEHRSLPSAGLAILTPDRHATAGWADRDTSAERHEEEWLNLATHAAGLALALVGAWLLVSRMPADDPRTAIGTGIYAASLVALYAASTLSHLFHRPRLRTFFRMVDQICIFGLIAGTSTPLALAFFPGTKGLVMASLTWSLALVGIGFKVLRRREDNVGVWCFVALGWLPLAALPDLLRDVPGEALALICGGGALYTIGTIFLCLDRRVKYFHAIWHVMVIAASSCHWLVAWKYAVGR